VAGFLARLRRLRRKEVEGKPGPMWLRTCRELGRLERAMHPGAYPKNIMGAKQRRIMRNADALKRGESCRKQRSVI
jgi:hypothetical protein